MVPERTKTFRILRPIFYVGVFFVIGFGAFNLNVHRASAVTCTAVASTAWNVTTTWGASGCSGATGTPSATPGSADDVIIPSGFTVTIPTGTTLAGKSVTINAAAAADGLGITGTLNITNNLTFAANSANPQTVTLNGTANLSVGTIVTSASTGVGASKITCASGATGTLTVTGTTASAVTLTGSTVASSLGSMIDFGTTSTACNLTMSGTGGGITLTAASGAVGPALVKMGTGTISLNTGGLTFAGTNTTGKDQFSMGVTGGTIILNGTTLPAGSTAATYTFTSVTNLNAATGANTISYATAVATWGNLTVGSGASLALPAVLETFNGATITCNGTISGVTGGIALGTSTAPVLSGTCNYTNTASFQILTSTTGNFAVGSNWTFAGSMAITAAKTITNNGTVTLSNATSTTSTTGTFVNAASATLNIGGALGASTVLTATASSNTVNYNQSGAITQTCKVTNYINLTFTNTSGAKVMTCNLVSGTNTVGGTVTMTNSGTSQTWTLGSNFPTITGNLSIGSGNVLANASTFTLTVTGDLTVDGTLNGAGTGTTTVSGNVAGTGTVNLTGNLFTQTTSTSKNFGTTSLANGWTFKNLTFTATSGTPTFTVQAGTGSITSSGTVTIGASATLDMGSGNRSLILSNTGTPFVVTGTFTATSGTVQYTGASANVTATTYKSITLGGTGSYTWPNSSFNIKGNLTISAGASASVQVSTAIVFSGGGAQTISDGTTGCTTDNTSCSDLGPVSTATASTNVSTSTNISLTSLTIAGSTTWDITGDTMLISGGGAAFSVTGTFTTTSSTVIYDGGSNTTITATTYNNLTLKAPFVGPNYTAGGNIVLTGSLTIGDGAQQTNFIAPAGTLSIGGDFTNTASSIFTHNSGTVIFTGSGISTIATSGALTFNNLQDTVAGSTLKFTNDAGGSTPLYTFAGTVTITGTSGAGHITITSNNQPTNKWMGHFSNATSTITHVTVSYSDCDGTSQTVTLDSDSTSSNNGTCWTIATSGKTITGTVYSDDGTTAVACQTTLTLTINGASPVTATCNTNVYSFTSVAGVSAGQVLTIYNNTATTADKGAIVSIANDGSTTLTMDFYKSRLIIHPENSATSVTNTNLAAGTCNAGCTGTASNTGGLYSISSGNMTLAAGFKLIVWTADTYAPAGTVTTTSASTAANPDGDVLIKSTATLNMGTNALSVGGDYTNSGTFTKSSGQTTTFTATNSGFTITSGTASNFDSVIFNGASGIWTTQDAFTADAAVTVTAGNFTVGGFNVTVTGATSVTGTLTLSSSTGTKTFTGDVTINTNGIWNNSGNAVIGLAGSLAHNGTTFTAGSGVYTMSGSAKTISGTLSIPSLTVSGTVTNNGTLTVATALAGAGTLTNGNSATLNLGGTSGITTLTANGTSNLVNYTGSAQTCVATSYVNLTVSGSGAFTCATTGVSGNLVTSGSETWTLSSTFTVTGNLTLGTGTAVTTGAFGFTVSGTSDITGALHLSSSVGTKTLTGLVTVNNGGTLDGAATTIITSSGIANSGTVTITGTDTMSTAGAAFSGGNLISIATLTLTSPGTATNNGTLTISTGLSGTGTLTQGSGSTLNIGFATAPTITALDANTNTNTVNYTAAAPNCKVVTYSTLNFTGSGAITCAVTSVTATLALSGTVTFATTSSITVGTSTTLATGTSMTNANGNTLTSPTLSITSTGSFTNNGIVTTSTALSGTGTFTNGATGTLNVGFATAPAITTLDASTNAGNIVNYSAASPTCKVITYSTLNFSGSGTVTCAATTVANINLSGTVSWTTSASTTASGTVTVGTGTTLTNASANTLSAATLTVTSTGSVTNNSIVTLSAGLGGTGAFTNGNNSTLNVGGAVTITTLTLSGTSNLVNYTGAAQTCVATSYVNLTTSGSGAFTCAPTAVTGNLITSGSETWTLSSGFTVGGTLTVGTGTAITTSTNAFTVSSTSSITGALHLTGDTNNKTFTGLITVNNGGTLDGASATIVTSAGIANSGTVTITGTDTMSTAGAAFSGGNLISISTLTLTSPGSVSNTGTVTISTALGGTGTFTNAAGGTLNIGFATLPGISTLTASASSNTVNYTAASPTCKVTTYDILNFTGSGTITCAVTNVNTTLALSGSVSLTTSSSISVGTSTTLATGTSMTNANGNTLTSPTLSITTTGAFTNNGIVTTSTGLSGTGTFTNGATGILNVGFATAPTVTTFTASAVGNTVNYTAANPTCKVVAYSNLTFSGSGTVTCATLATVGSALTLSGTVSYTTGAILSAGSLSVGAGTGLTQGAFALTVTGNTILGGTFTGSASALNLGGDLTLSSGSTWTKGGGTVTFNKGAAQSWTDSNGTTQDLGIVATSGASTAVTATTNIKLTSLTVGASSSFIITNQTMTVTGNGTPITTVVGGLTTTGSTIILSNTTSATVPTTNVTYNNLTLGVSGTPTYTLPAADITLRGNLSIASGSIVTKSVANKIIFAIGGAGSQTLTDANSGASDLGIIQISSNTGNSTLSLSSAVKLTSITVDASQTFTTNANTVTFTGSTPITGSFVPSTNSTIAFVPSQASGTVTLPANFTYYNVQFNKASNTFQPLSGTLTTTNTLDVTAGTLDLATNNNTTTIGGITTIAGTFIAPAGTLTIKGNFNNNGTFTNSNGTVAIDFSSISSGGAITIGGSTATTTFKNITASTATAGKILKFKAANTYVLSGVVTLTGTGSSPLKLSSDTPASQWIATLSGSSVLSFLQVLDSGCSGGNSWSVDDSVINLGNNGVCWTFVSHGGGVVGNGGNGGASGGGSGVTGGGNSGPAGGGSNGGSSGNADGTLVQSRDQRVTSGTTDVLAFTNNNTAGNLIVVYVVWGNTGTASIADTQGNTYNAVGSAQTWNGGTWSSEIFYAKNSRVGANTITATFGTTISNFGNLYITEYSGLDTTNPLDQNTAATGNNTTLASGNVSTTADAELIFGGGATAATIGAAGGGFNQRLTDFNGLIEDKVSTALGSYSTSGTATTGQWIMQIATFKAAGQGGGQGGSGGGGSGGT